MAEIARLMYDHAKNTVSKRSPRILQENFRENSWQIHNFQREMMKSFIVATKKSRQKLKQRNNKNLNKLAKC